MADDSLTLDGQALNEVSWTAHHEVVDDSAAGHKAEQAKDLDKRNEIAQAMFKKTKGRVEAAGTGKAETWWDKRSNNYVTMLKDADDYEVNSHTDYTGNKEDAAVGALVGGAQVAGSSRA